MDRNPDEIECVRGDSIGSIVVEGKRGTELNLGIQSKIIRVEKPQRLRIGSSQQHGGVVGIAIVIQIGGSTLRTIGVIGGPIDVKAKRRTGW